MCRILIVLKKNLYQNELINKFLEQAHNLKNTPGIDNNRDYDYHTDGYGFIFYDEENKIYFYKSYQPSTRDINFCLLKNIIKNSNIIIGHLRATKNHFQDEISYNNTHPFWFKNNFWIHNGCVFPFDKKILLDFIDIKYKNSIKGSTDSEYLFYVLLSFKIYNNDIESIFKFIDFLKILNSKYNIIVSANIVYSNKNIIFISRYINNNEEPPSLYIDYNKLIVSSEPVTNNYELICKNTCIIYDLNNKNLSIKRL